MTPPGDEHFMRLAIAKALAGIAQGQSPFGAAVARDGRLVSCEHNVVLQTLDVTAHAEIHALRAAATALGTIDLAGCTVYATHEPCAMCYGACHWAHVARIVYGASTAETSALGFADLGIPTATMRRLAKTPVELVGGVLRDQCVDLIKAWQAAGHTTRY